MDATWLGGAIVGWWEGVRWNVERYLAVTAFNRREAKRENCLYPTVWLSHLQLVARDLALLHESDPDLLNRELIEDLAKARAEIASSTAKLSAALSVLIAYLVFTSLNITIPISFGGLELSPSPGVSEFVIVVVAVLSSAVAAKAIGNSTLVVASKVLIPRVFPRELAYFKLIQFHANEPPPFYLPRMGSLTWKRSTVIANWLILGLVLAALVAVLGGSVAWRSVVYPDLWHNPSADPFWCRAAVLAAIVIDCGWVAYLLFYVFPFPHKDYAWLDAVTAAEGFAGGESLARHMRNEAYAEGINDRVEMQRKGYLPPDEVR